MTPQQKTVLEALQAGKTLTNMVAITCYGVGSLSSRIAELRKMGYEITDTMETDRFDRTFKKYRMPGTREEPEGESLE